MKKLMKKLKKLLVMACIACVGYGIAKLLETEFAKDKLFALLGEDLYLKLEGILRVTTDILMWPIDYVRALLP